MAESLNTKVVSATKWSSVTEIIAKLVTPITSMVLARLLTPEAYGVVATFTIVVSFAEIFTDAGFQKYLVQHEFKDDEDREQSTNVAFWSNFTLSMLILGIIAIFNAPLAEMVGSPGLGFGLVIASVAIPLAAFSSIQMALFKRDFDFKSLFKVRMVSMFVPLIVTLPLAFWLRSYWALVIGTLAQNLVNAVLLTALSKWKPKWFYSFGKLKEMLSFTIWSLFEAISIWLTGYIDAFIVASSLSQYYLGLYRTSSYIVGMIMGIITAATTPVLFSSLSRLQDDDAAFQKMFFGFQKTVGLFVIPLGVGLYFFSDLATEILLGNQWMETSGFIGLWALTSALTIVLSHYSSEVYRAKGKPKLSVLAQWLHIIVLWPAILIAVRYDYHTLYLIRSLVRLELIIVNIILMYFVIKITPWKMMKNIMPSCLAAIVMGAAAYGMLCFSKAIIFQIVAIVICAIIYFVVIMLFKEERTLIKDKLLPNILNIVKRKK